MTNDELIIKARRMCEENGSDLLYLVKFGSELYGTSVEGKSDTDVKGIYKINLEPLILLNSRSTLGYSTGNDKSKNTTKDVDIELWSIQKFMLMLVRGDIGAIDLLYSYSNKDAILYEHQIMHDILTHPSRYVRVEDAFKFGCNYAIGQAKKYGLKGSRLGVLKSIKEVLSTIEDNKVDLLEPYIPLILEKCGNEKYCYYDPIKKVLVVLGRMHMDNITLHEFRHRVNKLYSTYGSRAELAEQNQGIDYKAVSHAVRSMQQLEEIIVTGELKYPLRGRDKLIKIKQGEYTWQELETIITNYVDGVTNLLEKYKDKFTYIDESIYQKAILEVYGYR